MHVRGRGSPWRIVDDESDQRLAGNVGDRVLEVRRDGFPVVLSSSRQRDRDGDSGACGAEDGS